MEPITFYRHDTANKEEIKLIRIVKEVCRLPLNRFLKALVSIEILKERALSPVWQQMTMANNPHVSSSSPEKLLQICCNQGFADLDQRIRFYEKKMSICMKAFGKFYATYSQEGEEKYGHKSARHRTYYKAGFIYLTLTDEFSKIFNKIKNVVHITDNLKKDIEFMIITVLSACHPYNEFGTLYDKIEELRRKFNRSKELARRPIDIKGQYFYPDIKARGQMLDSLAKVLLKSVKFRSNSNCIEYFIFTNGCKWAVKQAIKFNLKKKEIPEIYF